jgi:hypothetical protein
MAVGSSVTKGEYAWHLAPAAAPPLRRHGEGLLTMRVRWTHDAKVRHLGYSCRRRLLAHAHLCCLLPLSRSTCRPVSALTAQVLRTSTPRTSYTEVMYVVGTAGHVDHGKSALVQAL